MIYDNPTAKDLLNNLQGGSKHASTRRSEPDRKGFLERCCRERGMPSGCLVNEPEIGRGVPNLK